MAPRARSVVATLAPATQAAPVVAPPATEAPPEHPGLKAFMAGVPALLVVLNAKGPDGKYTDDTGEAADRMLRPLCVAYQVPDVEGALKSALRLMLDARDQARRAALLDTLRSAVAGYTAPASLVALARQASEAGTTLALVYTPAVVASPASGDKPATEAKPEALALVVGHAPVSRTQAAPSGGTGSTRSTGPMATTGAAAYLGFHQADLATHQAAGKRDRVMPNGKVYSEGTNHNAGQALKAYLLAEANAGLRSLVTWGTDDKGRAVMMFGGQKVTSDLLRTDPRLK